MAHRLLLADDSVTIHKVVELILKPEGFEIQAYGDGAQALDALGSFSPDIVLADIEMPSLNGYELCESVKRSPGSAGVPVVLLAGAFEPLDEDRARKSGADDVIIKPFDTQELINKVGALLRPSAVAAMPSPSAAPAGEEARVAGSEEAAAPVVGAGRETEAPVSQEMAGQIMGERFSAFVSSELGPQLSAHLRDTVEKTVSSIAPPLVEEVSRQILGDLVSTMRPELERSFRDMVTGLTAQLRETAEKAIASALPGVVESVSERLIQDLLVSARPEIDSSLKRVVPEVAERLIQREIEKITSEL